MQRPKPFASIIVYKLTDRQLAGCGGLLLLVRQGRAWEAWTQQGRERYNR